MTVDVRALPSGTTALPARRSLRFSSAGAIAGKAAQTGTGFVFWVAAARLATQRQVGIAEAVVSAVQLCTQVGLLGMGAALIVVLNRERERLHDVLGSAVSVVALASAASAVVALVLLGASVDLEGVVGNPIYVVVFLVASVFGTIIICLDQMSVALGRGDHTLPRYLTSGVAAVGALLLVGWGEGSMRVVGGAVLACWTLDSLVSSLVGWYQIRRWSGRWVRPRLDRRRARSLLSIGVPNQVLTVTERIPVLLVPVLVVHTASPTTTAHWYLASQMAWVAYTAPVAVGLAQFAEIVRRPDDLRATTRTSVSWALLLGGAIALVLIVAAEHILGLVGSAYADADTVGALRLLALGLVPYAAVQAYNAVCRARGRLLEATITGATLAALSTGITVAVADQGTTAMAVAWLSVFAAFAVWCAARTVILTRPAAAIAPRRSLER